MIQPGSAVVGSVNLEHPGVMKVGAVAAIAQSRGFSPAAMSLAGPVNLMLMAWRAATGVLLWRRTER